MHDMEDSKDKAEKKIQTFINSSTSQKIKNEASKQARMMQLAEEMIQKFDEEYGRQFLLQGTPFLKKKSGFGDFVHSKTKSQQGYLRLQSAGDQARIRDRRVPVGIRADSLSTVPLVEKKISECWDLFRPPTECGCRARARK
ncbi:hypothetical protein PoB_000586200 [Plakobranchus ocellatus]|uniref:Uncharacterized protein n=1 Tax=Plakobranchus ocellatus TaxID=259542 RepID=A0AAV3YB72_9GAST|nr:hypothetical protein PoB_000586200 [Plakobranchus ocellatus]